ncbi:MAG: 3-phosphoshikimate 1-carboxyvinyltransferase [Actinobacteria bacterium]|nr:3-phosphoshikimate 1-carboxyvinyltransferase [Actinomycetota bacterium]
MRLRIEPGGTIEGTTRVPGDKSISHRWLILAATGAGSSVLRGLPSALDVASTAACLAQLAPTAPGRLEDWAQRVSAKDETKGFTWDFLHGAGPLPELVVEGQGWEALTSPEGSLDCGNSGTSMRMLSGVVAGAGISATLIGDEALSSRPMERIAEPLRQMGARVETTDGHAPMTVSADALTGITYRMPVPSAQVKSAVLFAGLRAEGSTVVEAPADNRDHTERALEALGAPVVIEGNSVSLSAFQHEGFEGDIPGDPSSAAFIVCGAAVTGSRVVVRDVGLNPSRTAFVEVLRRMGVHVRAKERWVSLGEPAGVLEVEGRDELRGVTVAAQELPSIIDEVAVLAATAAHASGESRFEGAGELRLKESDRLTGMVEGLRALGAEAAIEGDTLVVAGGGLSGGTADGGPDHRIGMALTIAALGASQDCFIDGVEWADISFPGFADCLVGLGALAEPA